MARGKLRIYLGAAAGVGKTFAMLNEGTRRRARGTDVVVAFVETHGRPNTADQIDDLEVIPRRQMGYRETSFEEMDLDAVLERRPEVALVDELAHTNVTGSRHAKRWEDIEELLDAGIDVISTVNIQHFESLNDVVEEITGITQGETVPDAVVRRADQIELVDMTPEALRRRMAHGNIYGPDRVDAALANYFREGNLAALRELALLWLADRVEEGLHDYRERHGIHRPWETRERVVVALTGAPAGDGLVRRAARIASRARAELIGVHVRTDEASPPSTTSSLARTRTLLSDLGGSYREAVGSDVAGALVSLAKAEGATQIVLGASHRSRWVELTRGSIVNRVVRQSGRAIDVHVISGFESDRDEGGTSRPRPRRPALSRRRRVTGVLLTATTLPILTVGLTAERSQVGLSTAVLVYLSAVVAVAAVGGIAPAALAAVAAFLLVNFYFAPPLHTLTIRDTRDVTTLVTFVAVGLAVGVLVDLFARRSSEASRARTEAAALASTAASLLRSADPLPELTANLVATFDLAGAAVLVHQDDSWVAQAVAGVAPPTQPSRDRLSIPLGDDALLVIEGALSGRDREVLDAFAAQLGVALEARRLQAGAAAADTLARSDELRSALLAAVSHDLRTPLASIKAAVTTLLSGSIGQATAAGQELLANINFETDRLNGLVANLLDMTRIQTGTLPLRSQATGVEVVVAEVLAAMPGTASRLQIDVPAALPPVEIDPALVERALANILDNALRYGGNDRVRIEAALVAGRVELRVVDRGPGIPRADRERVFAAFQRLGDVPSGNGVGLGLAVAKGFIDAVGGTLTIEDTPGGGTTMIMDFPA
ncbi:MAG: ATP-binding protein [Acidimicrobiales bacterium]